MSLFEGITGQLGDAHDKADVALGHLADQAHLLGVIAQNTEASLLRQTYQRIPFVATADATGVARVVLQVPQGIAWDLISVAGVGTAAGNLSLFIGNEDGTGLVTTVPVPATPFRVSYTFPGEESCPQGVQITILVEGQTVGADFRGNLKVNVLPEAHAKMEV